MRLFFRILKLKLYSTKKITTVNKEQIYATTWKYCNSISVVFSAFLNVNTLNTKAIHCITRTIAAIKFITIFTFIN